MVLMYFNFKDKPFTESTIPEEPIEVHSDSSEEDVEKVVDWTQKTLSTLSEIKEDTVDDGNDVEVGEVRHAQVRCSISSSASTFIKNLVKKVQEVEKEHH